MSVHVRLFAALREAAGTAVTTVEARTVQEALADLAARYGPEFARWVAVSSTLVGGDPADGATVLRDGDELVLLPPFSGG